MGQLTVRAQNTHGSTVHIGIAGAARSISVDVGNRLGEPSARFE
jgi:hypothetical protein